MKGLADFQLPIANWSASPLEQNIDEQKANRQLAIENRK